MSYEFCETSSLRDLAISISSGGSYYSFCSPEGLVSDLSSREGEHDRLMIILSNDPYAADEDCGVPIWNAVISEQKENLRVLKIFSNRDWRKSWKREDRERFDSHLSNMGMEYWY